MDPREATQGELQGELPLFETSLTCVLLNDGVVRSTLLTDEITAAGTADLRVEEERELVETAQTVAFVKLSVLCQQLRTLYILLDL